jgi:hypothetical protein
VKGVQAGFICETGDLPKAWEMKTKSDLNEQEMDLLYEAVKLADPAKRGAFLGQACAGNSILRTRVEELLVLHAKAEKFFCPRRTGDLFEAGGHLSSRGSSTLLNLSTR